jgi:GNAT superfamily N-acetyltransferase
MDLVIESKRETIIVPNALSIPGLSFRRFRSESDFPIMAEVMQKSRDADVVDTVETAKDISGEYKHLVNCDPRKDMLFAEIGGETVGFTRCQWRTAADGTRVYEQWVHLVPEWRGHGLRHAMLRWNERRIREMDQEHPTHAKKVMEVGAPWVENHLKSLIEEEGYRPHKYSLVLVRPNLEDIPQLPIPEGVEVRPAKPEHHMLIWKAEGEALREQAFYDEEMWSEEGLKAFSGWYNWQPDLWQVAWAGDEVVGAVLPWIDNEENERYHRNWGHTEAIFVRKGWRNRGLASALIARAMGVVRDHGASQAVLNVDSENPSGALRLYEKLGYRLHARYAQYRKPLD